ncbi:MAG: oligosaccharide 4-alpha-D-glucosyltransferase [Flavobacterium sp.]|jgi:oligosaccharide 4-alpha-D-glucosyltransferase
MKYIILFLFATSALFSQNKNRKFEKAIIVNDVLNILVSDGSYSLQFLDSDIVETTFHPKNEEKVNGSHALILSKAMPNATLKTFATEAVFEIPDSDLSVTIKTNPFQIIYNKKAKSFLSEKEGFVQKDSSQVTSFNISATEKLYGGGARVLGMNRRGNRLRLYNKAKYGYETEADLMNFCIPLVLSSEIYAVHFDNPTSGYLNLDLFKNNTLEFEALSGRKTYQVIIGKTWTNLIENYTTLTGKQPLPPRWAFGNFASRFGYHSQAETIKTIQKFKENNIPVDAVILDLYWFGKDIKGTMGNLEVFRDSFPDFEKMVSDFNKMGIKTIPVTEPFILSSSKKWNETKTKELLVTNADGSTATWDFYFGNTSLLDIFKPETKSWFWNIYNDLVNKGIGGVWGDLGEPEVFPSSANTVAGKADEVHNIYGHNWAKLIAEGYNQDFPEIRPFILMRSGYSGSQRFGMIPWSGDVNRTWGGLSGQTEIALQMGMQGLAYMHSDLGGFAGANLDDQLYTRWLQFGVFNPIFRPHAQEEVASEPVYRSIAARVLAKKAIELRYQMLPYNYNLAYQNATFGTPLMRPLFFEEPNNESLLSNSDEYLWGNNFLIAPVKVKNQITKDVYFPTSSNWFDFYTNQKYDAGVTAIINVQENYIPTFVRGNTFIPMTKLVQTTQDYNSKDLDLYFYYDGRKTSKEELYFDDGNTPNANFDSTENELLVCASDFTKDVFQIKLTSISDNVSLISAGKTGKIILKNYPIKPKNISINGIKVSFDYNKKTNVLEFNYSHQNKNTKITIQNL